MLPFSLFLVFSACLLSGASASCDNFCASFYNVEHLRLSCTKGCALSSDRGRNTQGVNLLPVDDFCRDQCTVSEASTENKAACYDGCSYIEPSVVVAGPDESARMSDFARNFLGSPFISRLLAFMNSASDDQSGDSKDDPSSIRTLRIHVIVPTDDENLSPLLVRPVPPELDFNEPHIYSDRPASHTVGRAMCQRLRFFAHHVASRPLLFVTVVFLLMNLVILLTFCCLRCRVRRMRKDAFKRQLRRMPAYFEPASVKIDMVLPQPPTEKEAEELPPKEPIV